MLRCTLRSTMQMAARHFFRPVCSGIRPLPHASPIMPSIRAASSNTTRIPSQPRIGPSSEARRLLSGGSGSKPPGATGGSGGGGGGSGGGGGGGNPWEVYLGLLGSRPVLTKSVTAAALNAVGDILAQKWVDGREGFDWKRLAKFSFLGLVLVGPVLHQWYNFMARIVPSTTTAGALQRLFLDQVVFAPIFISGFFTALMTIEGNTGGIRNKLEQDLKPAVLMNWKIWVPFQFLNFRFIPLNLQVLASNLVAIAWNTYLSKASYK